MSEAMTHAKLPDAILKEYPGAKLDDLKQNCWGCFYHYKLNGAIVGGYDFSFFIYTKDRQKKYFKEGK